MRQSVESRAPRFCLRRLGSLMRLLIPMVYPSTPGKSTKEPTLSAILRILLAVVARRRDTREFRATESLPMRGFTASRERWLEGLRLLQSVKANSIEQLIDGVLHWRTRSSTQVWHCIGLGQWLQLESTASAGSQ